ncbi:Ig-like domain-containing protein [Pleionea sp. CnH1-48]|uniref:PKD domain-containing protein n=1 Tax=Pleionea sp. CnH1-48 TaxID=2954494 RepID=UPI002097E831|nr:hypothetical protein [Pleionea sp. CnH1-48]MCO7225172.1 hypothetical protein [Pleionea sp. CnH1-48]
MNTFKKSAIAVIVASALAPIASFAETVSYHSDHRNSPKLMLNEKFSPVASKNAQDTVEQYLKANSERFHFAADLSNLTLRTVKESLTAKHYHYQQTLNGINVDKAEMIVSVNLNTGQIDKAYNNIHPVTEPVAATKSVITDMQAMENAWKHIQGSGQLQSQPTGELVYVNQNGEFRLVYKASLLPSLPRGDWELLVDATSGEVLKTRRIDLPLKTNANGADGKKTWSQFAKSDSFVPFADALAAWEKKSAEKAAKAQAMKAYAMKAAGTALTFDPDPRATLNDASLEDNTPAATFDPAYLTRNLQDITLNSGTYSLVGPWVQIIDWDAPTAAPSTTSDGNWTAKRGNPAFNDANTYFHIDQNQRYMQSLGFTGNKGIQAGSMEIDANGADGADNSAYYPGTNRLTFGHGCVDDNEDSDVILHEYGHAINYSINSNWSGGDTGSMGEGFGDYWAGSYSYSTPNGQTFNPNWVFSWDGHNNCWGGRVMNRTNFRYDSSQTYGAHQTVNGQLGDELWSTPIFQALVELMAAGQARTEMDQIILEAQFGLGAGLRMPDLANATVQAAQTLFPNGPHAAKYTEKFHQVGIINNAPIAQVDNSNFSVDEGTSVLLDATGSSDPDNDTITYAWVQTSGPSIALNNASSAQATFTAPMLTNDASLSFQVTVTDELGATGSADVNVMVIDTNNAPIARVVNSNIEVVEGDSVSLDASNSSDPDNDALTYAWTQTSGPSVTLSNASSAQASFTSPSVAANVSMEFSVTVTDTSGKTDTAIVNVNITDNGGNSAPVARVASASISVVEGGSVSLDASSSSDPDNDTLTYAWTQTSGPSVTLSNASSAQASFTAPTVTANTSMAFQVTVTDTSGATDTASVNVTVTNQSTGNGGGGGGGAFGAGLLALLLLGRRRSK